MSEAVARGAVGALFLWSIAAFASGASGEAPVGGLQSPWENAKLRGVAFRAIGQEPSWFMEITHGDTIQLFKAFGEIDRRLPFVEPEENKEERRTVFRYPAESIEIELRGEPCADIMSGEEFDVSVRVTTPNETLQGCGRALY